MARRSRRTFLKRRRGTAAAYETRFELGVTREITLIGVYMLWHAARTRGLSVCLAFITFATCRLMSV